MSCFWDAVAGMREESCVTKTSSEKPDGEIFPASRSMKYGSSSSHLGQGDPCRRSRSTVTDFSMSWQACAASAMTCSMRSF